MTYFTEKNTDGFTAEQLAEMNKALDILAVKGFEDFQDHLSSFVVKQAMVQFQTAQDYVEAYRAVADEYKARIAAHKADKIKRIEEDFYARLDDGIDLDDCFTETAIHFGVTKEDVVMALNEAALSQ